MPRYLSGQVALCTADLQSTITPTPWNHVGPASSGHIQAYKKKIEHAAANSRLHEQVILNPEDNSRVRYLGEDKDRPFFLVKASRDTISEGRTTVRRTTSQEKGVNVSKDTPEELDATNIDDQAAGDNSNGTACEAETAGLKRGSRLSLPKRSHVAIGDQQPVTKPEALCVVLDIDGDCFLRLPTNVRENLGPDKVLDLKADVFINGDFQGSQNIPARLKKCDRWTRKPFYFHGQRIDRLIEKPWVLVPLGQNADGSLRDLKRTKGGEAGTLQRYDMVNENLKDYARSLGMYDHKMTILGQYLNEVASMPPPEELQRPGGLKFAVIDVVISLGKGMKASPAEKYLVKPVGNRLLPFETNYVDTPFPSPFRQLSPKRPRRANPTTSRRRGATEASLATGMRSTDVVASSSTVQGIAQATKGVTHLATRCADDSATIFLASPLKMVRHSAQQPSTATYHPEDKTIEVYPASRSGEGVSKAKDSPFVFSIEQNGHLMKLLSTHKRKHAQTQIKEEEEHDNDQHVSKKLKLSRHEAFQAAEKQSTVVTKPSLSDRRSRPSTSASSLNPSIMLTPSTHNDASNPERNLLSTKVKVEGEQSKVTAPRSTKSEQNVAFEQQGADELASGREVTRSQPVESAPCTPRTQRTFVANTQNGIVPGTVNEDVRDDDEQTARTAILRPHQENNETPLTIDDDQTTIKDEPSPGSDRSLIVKLNVRDRTLDNNGTGGNTSTKPFPRHSPAPSQPPITPRTPTATAHGHSPDGDRTPSTVLSAHPDTPIPPVVGAAPNSRQKAKAKTATRSRKRGSGSNTLYNSPSSSYQAPAWQVPALSEDCVVTFDRDAVRQIPSERGGTFREVGVLMGVRYILS